VSTRVKSEQARNEERDRCARKEGASYKGGSSPIIYQKITGAFRFRFVDWLLKLECQRKQWNLEEILGIPGKQKGEQGFWSVHSTNLYTRINASDRHFTSFVDRYCVWLRASSLRTTYKAAGQCVLSVDCRHETSTEKDTRHLHRQWKEYGSAKGAVGDLILGWRKVSRITQRSIL